MSIEGLDKSGKHSQSLLLTKHLEELGYNAVQSEFHRYDSPTGELIMKWLINEWSVDQKTIELIMTADKQAQQSWFEELENQGVDFLILDRYTSSQIAYSTGSGIDPSWINELQKYLRKPDIELFIDIAVEESMARKGKHNDGVNDRYESDFDLLSRVRDNYANMEDLIVINGERGVDEVHRDILSTLKLLNVI